ncbi:MAG TPA: cell division protein FtsZ, partial [Anaerolineaceae bacterium]|nr:cell division protein FtsZ [Anaerolineaceae bacterium]
WYKYCNSTRREVNMDYSTTHSHIARTPIKANPPVLKVIGLGGGGQNAVDRMIELGLEGVQFIAANSDAQVLQHSQADLKIQLGRKITRGLGAGGDPAVGQAAAEESIAELTSALTGADMVFLTAGMGGGTGTGAIPVAARVAKSVGAVVVAVVSLPFSFEIGRRQTNARNGLLMLQQHTDTLITVPNDRLLQVAPRNLPIEMAFRLADDILRQGIQGISELITQPGLINVDFSHIKNMMLNGGGSLLAIGTGKGENRVSDALEHALHHPMLESIDLEDASGIIANFTGGNDLPFFEVTEALNTLQEKSGGMAEIVPGIICDDRMEDRVQVILVLTGIGTTALDPQRMKRPVPVMTPAEDTDKETSLSPGNSYQENIPDVHPELAAAQSELDVPAFMRRKAR